MAGRRALQAASIAALCLAGFFSIAAAARAAFLAPSFIRQWSAASSPNQDLSGIDVDRSGRVYMLLDGGGESFRVLRFRADGQAVPGQWAKPIRGFSRGGLTTDPQGHVLIAAALGSGQPRLLEYTSDGGLLAAIPAERLYGSALDADRRGRVYATGRSASGRPSINQYSVSGGKSKLIASAAYPGTPSDDFFPASFLGIAVAPSGTVYGSGVSTASSFLARYEVGLGAPISNLEKCPASGNGCFGGFGLEVAATAFPPDPAEQMVYAAGGYGNGADSGNFYATGIYRAFGDPSQYQGSFSPAPLPAPSLITPFDVAGSPCGGLLYTLNSRFGGPGGTYDGVEVQEFDTHAPRYRCPPSPKADLSGLRHRYSLRVARDATSPCTPCAKLLPSGRYSNRLDPGAGRDAARRQRAGLTFRFRASAAADATFLFRRVAGRGPKASLGGFVYPARNGRNRIRFSGVLREGRQLTPGAYRVTASAGAGRRHLRLTVLANR